MLPSYFPQILTWFGDVTSCLVGDLLERWPEEKEVFAPSARDLNRHRAVSLVALTLAKKSEVDRIQ